MLDIRGRLVLVTGGAGFIGSHLVDQLLDQGCSVRVIDNFVNGKRENLAHLTDNRNFALLEGDITRSEDAKKAVENVDFIFHLACLGVRHSIKYPHANHQVNALGTLNILEQARLQKVKRVLYCSSSEVYGTAQYVPMDEKHPPCPNTVYGASKLAGECYAIAYYRTYGVDTLAIRLFNTFGPRSHYEGDAGELIPKSFLRALNGKDIFLFGDGSQIRDFTFVKDSAAALICAMKAEALTGRVLNAGSGIAFTVKEIVEKILKLVGNTPSQIKHTDSRPGDVLRLQANYSVFKDVTQWQPKINFDLGLKETMQWFQRHPKGLKEMLSEEKAINW